MNLFHRLLLQISLLSCLCFLASCTIPLPPKPAEKPKETQSVSLPTTGGSPESSVNPLNKPTRTIEFTRVGQREHLRTGDMVNVIYSKDVNIEDVYIAYESTEDGYDLELTPVDQLRPIAFSKRCQSFIVASPARTVITYEKSVRYEQIIWTPRADGTWEVRMGSAQQGCQSDALEKIGKLRTREYEQAVPIEGKNTQKPPK